MDPRREWEEVMLPPSPDAPLGRSAWRHVHQDGSEHEAKVTYPQGVYGGSWGEVPPGMTLRCLDCGAATTGERR